MKHIAYIGIAALASLMFASCDKKDDNPEPLGEKTYTGFKELQMSYDGSPMSGKSVTLRPSGESASLTVDSRFDLSQLSDKLKDVPPIQAPGALPGTPELLLQTALRPHGSKYAFSGSGETEYVSYSYSGTATPSMMTMDFTDVKLKDLTYAGKVFAPAPAVKNASGIGYSQLPFHIVWEANVPVQIPGLTNGVEDLLKLLVTAPVIPVYGGTAEMSLTQVVESAVKSIAMRDDGCMPITYLQTANGAASFTQAPLSMIQYVVTSPGSMRLFVNPTDILSLVLLNNSAHDPNIPENPFGKAARSEESDQLKQILGEVIITSIVKLAPYVAAGIPVTVAPTASGVAIFLGSKAMLPVMKELLASLLQNPQVTALVQKAIAADPALSNYLPQINQLLSDLPALMAATTRVELGLNLVPYK